MAMHVFSYVIRHDAGFAPNPFGGFLTLATCKPQIRRAAREGDYIVGTGSSATVGNKSLVYAAQVAHVLPLAQYGESPAYRIKRPSTHGQWWRKHGDNIYYMADGQWKQRPNVHHGPDAMEHDLSGKNVLLCRKFWYFGADAIALPRHLRGIIKKGPGHKRITDQPVVAAFIDWLSASTATSWMKCSLNITTVRFAETKSRSLARFRTPTNQAMDSSPSVTRFAARCVPAACTIRASYGSAMMQEFAVRTVYLRQGSA